VRRFIAAHLPNIRDKLLRNEGIKMTVNVKENDILFKISLFEGLEKVTVNKVTQTREIHASDGALLKPNLRNKTSDSWDSPRYYIWSQELEDKYRLQNLQSQLNKKLKGLNVLELNETSLRSLLKVLDEIHR